MPPESDENLRLEIGHVLFIDIVGYSKLLIEEQRERLNELTEIVLGTAQLPASTGSIRCSIRSATNRASKNSSLRQRRGNPAPFFSFFERL